MFRLALFLVSVLLALPAAAQQTTISSSSASSGVAIVSVRSAAAESSHVLKTTGGNLYGIYADNFSATAGFILVFDAASAPGDGAVTPNECIPLPGNSYAF